MSRGTRPARETAAIISFTKGRTRGLGRRQRVSKLWYVMQGHRLVLCGPCCSLFSFQASNHRTYSQLPSTHTHTLIHSKNKCTAISPHLKAIRWHNVACVEWEMSSRNAASQLQKHKKKNLNPPSLQETGPGVAAAGISAIRDSVLALCSHSPALDSLDNCLLLPVVALIQRHHLSRVRNERQLWEWDAARGVSFPH